MSWFVNGASPIGGSRDTRVTIERQHLVMRGLQACHHHGADPLQKLVTQRVVFLAVFPQNCRVEEERGGRLDRACCKLPDIRREHPRPAEQVSCAKDLYWDRFAKAGL